MRLIDGLLQVFVTWSEVTISRDEDRSYKRYVSFIYFNCYGIN